MDFFNDLGKRFSSMARSVTEKTKESVEVTRISNDLRTANSELEQLFAAFGKVCYGMQSGEGDAAEGEALLERIRALKLRIDDLAAQRDELKDVRRCTGCGMVQPRSARYCSNCGKRLPEDPPKAEPRPDDGEFCPSCGAQRKGDSGFCDVCGKPFDPEDAKSGDGAEAEAPVEAVINVEEPEDAGEAEEE